MKTLNRIIYVLVVVLIAVQFKTGFSSSDTNVLKTDTIIKYKTIQGKTNIFTKDSLIPVYIDNSKKYEQIIKELKSKYKKVDSLTILTELKEAKTSKKYNETFKDSVLTAEFTAYTTGVLDSLKFKYKTKKQVIQYNQVTKYIYPRYRVLAGGGVTYNNSIDNSYITADLGIQTKKGNIYSLGIGLNKSINFKIMYSLFDKY